MTGSWQKRAEVIRPEPLQRVISYVLSDVLSYPLEVMILAVLLLMFGSLATVALVVAMLSSFTLRRDGIAARRRPDERPVVDHQMATSSRPCTAP